MSLDDSQAMLETEANKVENDGLNQYHRPSPRKLWVWQTMIALLLVLCLSIHWLSPGLSIGLLDSVGFLRNGGELGKAHRPNFIFIMTDDQDLHMESIAFQPAVQEAFVAEGTSFRKHFCTISICCPSRVSLLTGKAAHNTNVTDVSLPYGGKVAQHIDVACADCRRLSQIRK